MTRTTKEQFIDFAGDEPEEQEPSGWRVVTWSSKTDRSFAQRQDALDYIRANDTNGDWHIEPECAHVWRATNQRVQGMWCKCDKCGESKEFTWD